MLKDILYPREGMNKMIIGIDLGTTFSAMAFIDAQGNPQLIPNSEGKRTTPSAIMFEEDGSVIVGEIARENALLDITTVAEYIKDEMGNPNYRFPWKDHAYTPEELSALILKKLKKDAESYLGTPIEKAVITVPAYFNDAQRKATQHAGMLAGLDVCKIINEPTAAAIAFGAEKKLKDCRLLVYDLGGGTFDATIVHYQDNMVHVKATDGIRRLGGHFFDQEILRHVAQIIEEKHGIDLYEEEYAETLQELVKLAEDCKIHLSTRNETYLPFRCHKIRERIKITQEEYHQLIKKLYERTEAIVMSTLSDAEMTWEEIDMILLVGGATRTTYIRQRLKALSGKDPCCEINPDEAVAMGAAIQAAMLTETPEAQPENALQITDVSSHGIGIVTLDAATEKHINSMILERNTPLPAKEKRRFYTAEEDQEIIRLEVTEGEFAELENVSIIGSFEIEIPRLLPRGSEVEIEMMLDECQLLHVYTRIPSVSNFFKELHLNRNACLSDGQIVKRKDLVSKIQIA